MALDHPEVVNRLVLLDIVSTYDMYALSSAEFAKALFHWYLLTQDEPFPEDLILSSRKMYFRNALHIGRYNSENDTSSEAFPQEVYDEYLRHYNMECIHAICEEYRAGECIDRFLDKEDLDAGKKITAETLVLWGANGLVEKFFNPLQCWLKFCINVQGRTLPCGSFYSRGSAYSVAGRSSAVFIEQKTPHTSGFSGGVVFAGRGAWRRSEINLVKGSAKA